MAESTWSAWEPGEGKFDFSQLEKTLDAAQEHGLSVIVGTLTYAIPSWLARKYQDFSCSITPPPCKSPSSGFVRRESLLFLIYAPYFCSSTGGTMVT